MTIYGKPSSYTCTNVVFPEPAIPRQITQVGRLAAGEMGGILEAPDPSPESSGGCTSIDSAMNSHSPLLSLTATWFTFRPHPPSVAVGRRARSGHVPSLEISFQHWNEIAKSEIWRIRTATTARRCVAFGAFSRTMARLPTSSSTMRCSPLIF